ncbi:hypothetical protein D3C83_257600 [compost metagenome]
MGRAKQEGRKRQESPGPTEQAGSSMWLYVVAGVAIVALAILAALLLTHTQR